jgi:predicted SAM-dependent methyltransferase
LPPSRARGRNVLTNGGALRILKAAAGARRRRGGVRIALEWSDVLTKEPLYLNLGGAEFRHPAPGYEGYISVDTDPPPGEWSVKHDLTEPIPLPDCSVTRIHTEDFLEHITEAQIRTLLAECHRLLVPGGMMRIGVPDYNNPKDRHCLRGGVDPRYPTHVTLTRYELMKRIIEESPFSRFAFYHYWDGDRFIERRIDYSLGMVRRTPDNDPHCRRGGIAQHVKTAVRDCLFLLSRGFRVADLEMQTRKYHRLHVTSLVVDLFKDER